jgi:hypothetical protein
MKQILSEEFRRMQKLAGIITENQYKREIEEISLSGPLEKIKNLIMNSGAFNKFIDTIVSKMSEEDKENFKSKLGISLEEMQGSLSFKDILSKVNVANPDKDAKDLNEELDRDTFAGKVVNLIRNLTGINLMALGGAPLGVFIGNVLHNIPGVHNSLGRGEILVGMLISLVASLIIHGISRKLLGLSDGYPLVGD